MSSIVVAGDTSGSITIAAPAVAGSGTLTLPVATDTLVGKATVDTLTNKSIAATQLTGTLPVANGGTGVATTTAYGVLAGGTTTTGALQNIGAGTAAQVLTSNGASALPTFQTPASGGVTTIGFGTTGLTPASATGGVVTVAGTLAVGNGGTGVTTSTGTGSNVLSASPTFTGTPLTTTAASTTNTTQIATTAFAYGTLSAATNGYTKLANGMICQWGQASGVASGAATVTYPIAFPTACYSFVITCVFSGNVNGSADATVCFSPVGAASTTIHSTITGTHCWMAWGI